MGLFLEVLENVLVFKACPILITVFFYITKEDEKYTHIAYTFKADGVLIMTENSLSSVLITHHVYTYG